MKAQVIEDKGTFKILFDNPYSNITFQMVDSETAYKMSDFLNSPVLIKSDKNGNP